MTLTQGQGQRLGQIFRKIVKNPKELVISRRLFHLQTSYLVPRYNSYMHIQWSKCRMKVKVKGQGRIFPKMGKKTKQLAISQMLFYLQTSYLKLRYNPIRRIQWPKVKGQGKNFPKMDEILNNWPYFGCYFTHRLHHIYYHSFLDSFGRCRLVCFLFVLIIVFMSHNLFEPHTTYLVPKYNLIRRI